MIGSLRWSALRRACSSAGAELVPDHVQERGALSRLLALEVEDPDLPHELRIAALGHDGGAAGRRFDAAPETSSGSAPAARPRTSPASPGDAVTTLATEELGVTTAAGFRDARVRG